MVSDVNFSHAWQFHIFFKVYRYTLGPGKCWREIHFLMKLMCSQVGTVAWKGCRPSYHKISPEPRQVNQSHHWSLGLGGVGDNTGN